LPFAVSRRAARGGELVEVSASSEKGRPQFPSAGTTAFDVVQAQCFPFTRPLSMACDSDARSTSSVTVRRRTFFANSATRLERAGGRVRLQAQRVLPRCPLSRAEKVVSKFPVAATMLDAISSVTVHHGRPRCARRRGTLDAALPGGQKAGEIARFAEQLVRPFGIVTFSDQRLQQERGLDLARFSLRDSSSAAVDGELACRRDRTLV